VWETTVDGFDHQSLPFEKLVEHLQPERNSGHAPFFQVMFGWRGAHSGKRFELPGLTAQNLPVNTGTSKFDLTLFLDDDGEEISGSIEYNTDLFDEESIRRMAGHYNALLESAVAQPASPISSLPMLSAAERRHILVDRNQTTTAYPAGDSIHALFEAQAAGSPDAIAVQYG